MFALFNCVEVLTIAKDKNEMPINEQIRVAELMVIGPNGEQMGVKNIKDALTLANYAGLDLVLMSGNGALDMNNPMMLYFLMSGDSKDSSDMLPLMLMMNQKLM